ncbi:Forkhead box protein N4 [Lucilia cuprina]|nr:Forkhead box protein N4 [Lucilia cuprina]
MFELEEYAGGFHDGFLNKYADSSGPTLDFYISDSLQDMLDIDIRSEVANVVGSVNDYESCLGDLPTSLEHATDSLSLLNSNCSNTAKESGSIGSSWNTSSAFGLGSSNSSSSWFGASNDFLADVGACVNPISVMPLISSSLIHMSPKTNLNANILRSNSPPPPSPNVNDTKSHLTFSPAHIKISAHSIRNEQITSHIPKQIVAISSAVTSATTVPATLATNSVLQRKNAAVDAIRKDLGADLRKVVPISSASENILFKTATSTSTNSVGNTNSVTSSKTSITTFSGNSSSANQTANNNNNSSTLNGGTTSSSTIKLGPGIGGLTFANNITYNKLKQQSNLKSSTASASTSATITSNGTIVLKRERESSPMQTISNNGQHVTKILSRNSIQSSSSFTPKSIASSAHHTSYALQQHHVVNGTASLTNNVNNSNNNSNGNHNASLVNNSGNSANSVTVFTASGLSSLNNSSSSGSANSNIIAVKPLQQKIKATVVESEFPKPAYSYSCLIAMALKNSRRGSLPVSEIYSFMCEHFPYFKTAPSGWKNSVRHNLSLNKCFEKIEKPPTNGNQRKGCLWAMNPERIAKMDEEVQKWSRKDPMAIRNAMVCPDNLEALERGEMKHGSSGDSDVEMDSQSEIEEASDMEEQELDETLVDNLLVEEDVDEDIINGTSSHVVDDNEDNDSCDRKNLHTTISSPLTISTKTTTTSNTPATCIPTNIHRDFDIEVEDIYDAIDIDDDKEAVRMAISQSDIIELSPADYNISGESHQSPKRARLNVNYSIGPAGDIEKQFQSHNQQQQLQIQNIKKIVKVQNVHDLQQIQQQLQQQHQQIVVQTITTNNNSSQQTLHQQQGNTHFTHIGRKMQLVNRIS